MGRRFTATLMPDLVARPFDINCIPGAVDGEACR
jgi:hypothetical protein